MINQIKAWNTKHPIGTKVVIMVNNSLLDTVTASDARIHPDPTTGIPCVKVHGYGFIPLDDCEAV